MKQSDLNIGSKVKLNLGRIQGKIGKNSQSLKSVKKVTGVPEHTKCKPLSGKVFYLDLPSNVFSEHLEKDIKELGGAIEGFLSKDISYLISNKKEAKFVHTLRKFSPEASPESAQNVGNSSPCPYSKKTGLDESAQKAAETLRISRGKSLVQKAIKEQEIFPSNSVLSNALSWGVKVIHVDDIKGYIEQKKRGPNAARKQIPSVKGKGCNNQKGKSGRLKKPFVKVEDGSRHYRPFYLQLSSFPVINYSVSKTYSPFDVEKNVCAGQTPQQAILRNKTNTDRESETQVQQNCKDKKKKGYCECCVQKYEDLQSHVESEQHRMFAESTHYQVVDDMISKFIYDFVEYRANESNRFKCSTGEIIPVKTVLSKDQLEERLKKIYIVQQQPFKKRPVLSLHKYKFGQQPKEALDCLFKKPAAGSEPASLLSFHHAKVATKVIKNSNIDSKGFLKGKHVQVQQDEIKNCISKTQGQHNHLINTVNRTSKSVGRLSLKKRKLDGPLVSQMKSRKVQNYEHEVEIIPVNIDKSHTVENSMSLEVGQLLNESVNKAFLPLSSKHAQTKDFDIEGCTIPNLTELEPAFHCTGPSLQLSPAKDDIFELNPVTPIPNLAFSSDSLKENCTIKEEWHVLQNDLLNSSSSVWQAKGLSTLDLAPLCSSNTNNSRLNNDQMKGIFKTHERELDTQFFSVNSTSLNGLENVFKKSAFDLESTVLSDHLELENLALKENSPMNDDEQVPYSTSEQAVLGFSVATHVNTSALNTLVGKDVESQVLKSPQLEENVLIQENAQFLPVKATSFITTENFNTSDFKPPIGSPKSLDNCQLEDNGALHKSIQNLQNSFEGCSVIFQSTGLKTSNFHPVVKKVPEGFGFENHWLKENCKMCKQVQCMHNSPVKDTSFDFQETIFRMSSLEAVANTVQLDNHHSKDISLIHEDLHVQCVSPTKDASFILPANNLETSNFDTVVGEMPNCFNLQKKSLKEDGRLNELEQVPQNSPLKDTSSAPVLNRNKSHCHPLVDKIAFQLKDPILKETCTIHETGQHMHNSPVKDGRFILPTKCLKMSGFDPVCNISYCFRLENYSSEGDFTNADTKLVQHSPIVNEHLYDINSTPDHSPSGKLQRKIKVYTAKNKRAGQEVIAELCQKQTEGTPQHNLFAISSPMKSLLELFQSSEANSDFLGFTSYPGRDYPNVPNNLEDQSCSSSVESVFDLFHTRKDHSDFEAFASYLIRGKGSAGEYGEETSSSTPTGLLELFQTSRTHSDFVGFTSFTNDFLEEQSSTPLKKLFEMFLTSEAQSDFQGFTSYTEKEGGSLSNDWQTQSSSTLNEDLLQLLQTSETHSDFEGFTSYCGIEDQNSPKDCSEDQQSCASLENGLELLHSSGAQLDVGGCAS